MENIEQHKKFMLKAFEASKYSRCIKEDRQVGAVIVKDDQIIGIGYNGAPTGSLSCIQLGNCLRENYIVESGTRLELCRAIHAEQMAIVEVAKSTTSIIGSTMYVTHKPCLICERIIAEASIKKVYYVIDYPRMDINNLNIDLVQLKEYELI